MSQVSILKPSQFDIKNVQFSSIRENPTTRAKSMYINYNGSQLLVQTPKMNTPFGLNANTFGDAAADAPKKYSLPLSFGKMDDPEKDREIIAFHRMIQEIEAALLKMACEKSIDFFKKQHKPDMVKEFFSAGIKRSIDKETSLPNGKYPDTLNIKLDSTGKAPTEVYINAKTPETAPFTDIFQKGASCVALLNCSCWIANGKFGVTWRAKQIKYYPIPKLSGYSITDDDESEAITSALSTGMAISSTPAPSKAASAPISIPDDEEEEAATSEIDEGDDEETPAPAPAPAPAKTAAKKVVVAKKK